jgi:hypothetical protein
MEWLIMVLLNVGNLGAGFSFGVRSKAQPGSIFPNEPTVTASDPTNAAKLGPLGYVASPTSNWTTGQKITVNGFAFNWTGAAWAAGTHAVLREGESAEPAESTTETKAESKSTKSSPKK